MAFAKDEMSHEYNREGKFVCVPGMENKEVVLHECSIHHAIYRIAIVVLGCA